MVSVSDVKIIYFSKFGTKLIGDFFVVDNPYGIGDSVIGNEIVNRRVAFLESVYDGADALIFTVGKEDGTCICVAVIYVADAVCLLICTGEFVFFDDIVYVIVDGGTAYDTVVKICEKLNIELMETS